MEIGSLVRLKSGSPNMTVTGYTMNNGATLVSLMVFVAGAYQIIQVDSRALIAVERSQKKPLLARHSLDGSSPLPYLVIAVLIAAVVVLSLWGVR